MQIKNLSASLYKDLMRLWWTDHLKKRCGTAQYRLAVKFQALALARNSFKMLLNLIGSRCPRPRKGNNERIDMDRERYLTKGDTATLYLITLTDASAWSDEG
jgi:hypothetical protein